jgi:2-polyprenyl-3-methyl-5-hydroxy-6-metoxy-1,4-benzoquinol methylase
MMAEDYRHRLFASYNATHASYLDADDLAKRDWFVAYARINYLTHLKHLNPGSARILEIACNKGYLLAALQSLGFKDLHGVDLSPVDVEKAQALLPDASIACIDASTYLDKNLGGFDVIVLKALLEHVRKDQVIPLLEKVRAGLAPGGVALIEVPNMDWLLAHHERYMDFTHEVGFTREALAQVMRNVFTNVAVFRAAPVVGRGLKTKLAAIIRPALIAIVGGGLRILGEGASEIWWDSRSIIGIAKAD